MSQHPWLINVEVITPKSPHRKLTKERIREPALVWDFRHCPMRVRTATFICMDATPISASHKAQRRWPRHRLDVPVRIVIHTAEKTLIRDGRGRELSEGGMCFASGVELQVGDQVEVEFTPAYSGEPIRVRAVARNRTGYNYGVEFVASSDDERQEIACLRENLQTLSSSYSPS